MTVNEVIGKKSILRAKLKAAKKKEHWSEKNISIICLENPTKVTYKPIKELISNLTSKKELDVVLTKCFDRNNKIW